MALSVLDAKKTIALTLIGALALSPLFLGIVWVDAMEVKTLPRLFSGNFADPPHADDGIPENALRVYFGSNVAWSNSFPHTILMMRGDPMLVIDKDQKGRVFVKVLRIFNAQDEIQVRFDDGDIWVNQGIRTKRPDKSTLVIYDKSDKEVLNLSYLNPHSIKISGVFLHPPSAPVIVGETSMSIGGATMSGGSFGGNGIDIVSR